MTNQIGNFNGMLSTFLYLDICKWKVVWDL